MGNISLAVMERGLLVQKFIWQGWVGTIALYAALTVHFLLGLYALYERRRLHWTPPELYNSAGSGGAAAAGQPPRGDPHRLRRIRPNKGYAQELYSFWIASPALG